jgi:hypothetical protein
LAACLANKVIELGHLRRLDGFQDYDVAVSYDNELGSSLQPEALADLLGDDDLAFGRELRRCYLAHDLSYGNLTSKITIAMNSINHTLRGAAFP